MSKKDKYVQFLTYDYDFHLFLEEQNFKDISQLRRLKNWVDGAIKHREKYLSRSYKLTPVSKEKP